MSKFGLLPSMTKAEANGIIKKYLDRQESTYMDHDKFKEARKHILRDFYDECKELGIDMTIKKCGCCGVWS